MGIVTLWLGWEGREGAITPVAFFLLEEVQSFPLLPEERGDWLVHVCSSSPTFASSVVSYRGDSSTSGLPSPSRHF